MMRPFLLKVLSKFQSKQLVIPGTKTQAQDILQDLLMKAKACVKELAYAPHLVPAAQFKYTKGSIEIRFKTQRCFYLLTATTLVLTHLFQHMGYDEKKAAPLLH